MTLLKNLVGYEVGINLRGKEIRGVVTRNGIDEFSIFNENDNKPVILSGLYGDYSSQKITIYKTPYQRELEAKEVNENEN